MNYLNTNTQIIQFQKIAGSSTYVDKSMMIEKVSAQIMAQDQYICITRPRRFGKTVNANMLGAYYTKGYDSTGIFGHLAIAGSSMYQTHRNKHNVIHIDLSRMPDFCTSCQEYLADIIENIREDLKAAYPELGAQRFRSISRMLQAAGDAFIFILDEWDFILHQKFMAEDDKKAYLLFTRDEILSAMVVYGFLSYYGGCLRIPNHELMEKYQSVLSRDSLGDVKKIVDDSREMLAATLAGDEKKAAAILEAAHDREIPFLEYNDENSLSCVVTLCYLYARKDYYIEREGKSGKGCCDYLFYPKEAHAGRPAIILELNVGHSAREAVAQIKDRNYMQKVEVYENIILVGISYDKTKKKHECMIEE